MRIGIDLGGTKTELAALDPATGAELCARVRTPTPREYDGVIRMIGDLVAGCEAKTGRTGTVGVGIPGTVSKQTGLVKNANSTWLIGKPLDRDLAEVLGRPVRLQNDANCFAVSEAHDGAGAGAEVVFGVIIGTGTGAGIVVRGEVLGGVNGIGGEWGHNPLPWPRDDERPGPACYCGKHGCVETWVSGPALAADYRRATGEDLTTHEIAEAATPEARAALDRYADRLARGLAHVINIVDPDVIVLGGGMGNLTYLYEEVPRRWGAYVFSDSVVTALCPPTHGDSSGVRGAAWLWLA
jgi:fructokinase